MRKLLTKFDNNILKWLAILTTLFIVLYPKLPSIHVIHTWVYIRLEDFAIGILVVVWLVQLVRRKARLALLVGIPIIVYWIVGLVSLAFSIHFVGPHLANFFPSIATLEYLRRIEYMILFFVGFSVIRTKEDLVDVVRFIFIGLVVIILYGLGQHFYPYFWKYLPEVIQKTNFCFPSFQTGNEEFAKGIPLCLPVGSRVTSTFGGHYDLAGYLLITLPILLGTWMIVKKKVTKVFLGILYITGVIVLILTSSRIAFGAYIFAVIPPLVLLNKKKWIVPIILLSFVCLILFSQSTINRFAQTFRLTTVVVNMQGQVVGTTENGLSAEQQKQLANGGNAIQANQVIQGVVPEGSSFITLPQQRIATTTAIIKHNLTTKEAQQLQLANGGLQISTLKGNFSVQKALVYDISVTTRLQGEWPNAISAFLRYPLVGQGYSTLTLAVDNDFLRLLGESGILGFVGFIFIFVIFGIFLKSLLPAVEDPLIRVFNYGLIGGVTGLIINATLFDIFEASKVAEPLWLLLGIGLGAVTLTQRKKVHYVKALFNVATTRVFLCGYLLVLTLGLFWSSLNNFFIGDDFVWLKWAATSTFADVSGYFTNAGGFFYRPLDKLLMLLFYSVFSFQPQGYHAVILFLLFLMAIGVYDLIHLLFKRKLWAFLAAGLFVLLPMHAENVYWISALSIDLSSVAILFATILYIKSGLYKNWLSVIRYVGSIILAGFALLSYELALVVPLLVFASDIFITKKVGWKRSLLYIPFIVLDLIYIAMRFVSHALTMGGDYSYSMLHFIPNSVGNIMGYVGLLVFGQWSLPYYTMMRTHTKAFAFPLGIVIVILLVGIVYFLRKTNWKNLIKNYSLPLFGIACSLVTLLPYLGLGNIAQRYGYLASVGFIIVVLWLFEVGFEKIKLDKKVTYTIAVLIGLLVVVWCLFGLGRASDDWTTASKITYNSLGYIKIEYPTVRQNSTFIIINRPITYKDAWVFPTGLPEGLWFVYGNQTPQVKDASSLTKARQLAQESFPSYIFTFDKNFAITKVR